MIAALLLVASFAIQAASQAERPVADVPALRAAWRESLELDVPGEILSAGAWIEREADADAELTALYARALHAAGEDVRAAQLLARGESAPLVLAAARIALDGDEIARAASLLAAPGGAATATPRFPDDPECWLLLGRAEARAGRLARAEANLVEFVKRAPWHVEAPQAWFLLVDAARARGDAPEALRREESRAKSAEWQAFYRARRLQVRASPAEPLPRYGLAQLWLAAGELASAQREVERALVLDPRFCRGLELDAEITRRRGDAERARTRCAAALECDPKLVEVHLTLARLARDAGDAEGSARELARYRELGGTKDP
ncbi:MAG: hypothetical protein NTY35_11355 [Planctomycetota bacterium]|nr:hypothetical protein [Planctomycetota bacterium]